MSTHRILAPLPHPTAPEQAHGRIIHVEGEEADHAARAKRLAPGESVEVIDGRGWIGEATVEQVTRGARRRPASLALRLSAVRVVEPVRPRVEVFASLPKGDRAAAMIDGLSQVGAASWHALECERSVASLTANKIERLRRVAVEAAKQCGRAWLLEIGERSPTPASAAGVRTRTSDEHGVGPPRIVIADAGAPPYSAAGEPGSPVRLLIGPEGGFTDAELDTVRGAGAVEASFGPHVMRVESAAIVAAAIAIHAGASGH